MLKIWWISNNHDKWGDIKDVDDDDDDVNDDDLDDEL